ncbi:hypothetical protein C8R45DRAFT_1036260 [Mycena sanguinolenta]|nr:hypothetical protein C8R45DRAFT_1036260 [Mycena sanguinolenta]
MVRAFGAALHLRFPVTITGLKDGSWFTESGSRLTEELLRIASRWRSLRIVGHTTPAAFVQLFAGSKLDSLEELNLWSVDPDGSHFDGATISSFTTAPRLRKVTIDTTGGIPIPWAQLTDITLEKYISPEKFLDIFSQCVNVVRASIYCTGWSVTPSATLVPVVLHHLHCLSVTWVEEEVLGMLFLDCLTAPDLDELHLCFEPDCQGMRWEEAAVTAFQLRSPNITKLKIDGNGFSIASNALITALRHAPFLTHLSIDDCQGSIDDGVLLDALCYGDDVTPLVPHLHCLALAEMDRLFPEEALGRMIASRWWTDEQLASRSRPPTVARWTQTELGALDRRPSRRLRDAMKDLRQTGLVVVWKKLIDPGPPWFWK